MLQPKRTALRARHPQTSSLRTRKGKPSVFAITPAGHRSRIGGRAGFDYPAVQEGTTPHFVVYYDPALGADGVSCADGVLATCENDYAQLSAWFGGIDPPDLPIHVIIAALDSSGHGGGGAYHYGCSAVDLYCDLKRVPGLDVDYTRMLMNAELVEVFEAAQGVGWDCGGSNGEGLSRVLATALYPAELDGYTTAAAWLDTPDRPDWVNSTDRTDTNPTSTGCAVLFLNYLHTQLGFDWSQIVQAGAPTLAQTYTQLTGAADGWTPFRQQLEASFPIGSPSGVTTDDPYPLP